MPEKAKVAELSVFGELHDAILERCHGPTIGGDVDLLFRNIYLIGENDQEEYLPNSLVTVHLSSFSHVKGPSLDYHLGAFVNRFGLEDGELVLSTSSGATRFCATGFSIEFESKL